MKTLARITGVVAMLVLVGQASAATIDTTGSYDGSYQPDSATPPAGQSTWALTITDDDTTTESVSLTENDPSAGLATFLDEESGATGNGSIIMNLDITDSNLDSSPATTTYAFEARVKINSYAQGGGSANRNQAVWSVGFKDEGGSGKSVRIGQYGDSIILLNNDNGRLYGTSGTQYGVLDGFALSLDTWYTFRVEKFDDAGTMKVKVSVNGTQQDIIQTDGSTAGAYAYGDLVDDSVSTTGFEFRTANAHTVDLEADYVKFVPEPATMVLLGLGGVGLLLKRRRRT